MLPAEGKPTLVDTSGFVGKFRVWSWPADKVTPFWWDAGRLLLPGYCNISSEPDARDHRWMCRLGISSEPPVFFLDVFFWTFYVLFWTVGGYDINHWTDWEEVTTMSEPSLRNEQVVHAFVFDQAMHELLVRSVWIMALQCRYAIPLNVP